MFDATIVEALITGDFARLVHRPVPTREFLPPIDLDGGDRAFFRYAVEN